MLPKNNNNNQEWPCRTRDDVCYENGLMFRRVTIARSADEHFKKQIKNREKNVAVIDIDIDIDIDSATMKNQLQIVELEKELRAMRDQKMAMEMAEADFKA